LNFIRVSSDASVSNDEDVEDDNSVDSFIDDRINATAASQPGASRMDMMAIYRYVYITYLCYLYVGFP
jgi:hypothetical protein